MIAIEKASCAVVGIRIARARATSIHRAVTALCHSKFVIIGEGARVCALTSAVWTRARGRRSRRLRRYCRGALQTMEYLRAYPPRASGTRAASGAAFRLCPVARHGIRIESALA